MRRLALSGLAWILLVGAAPVPPSPPGPELAPLVPWAAAPLDKPALALPRLALPAAPVGVPTVAPALVVLPEAPKPTEALPSPRSLPCVGAWLRIATELLECGWARFGRGELEDAARAFEQAARPGGDPDVVADGRYWLAETLYRLGQLERADWLFRQVVVEPARTGLSPWAVFGSGYTALRLGDAPRAEETFRKVLGVVHPVALDAWARHGLGLALYAQGKWLEADKVWADASSRRWPPALDRDALFWYGDVEARVGRPQAAVQKLGRFTEGGPHPLLAPGLVRLGWWFLAAGSPAESVTALRSAIRITPATGDGAREREWAEAGLALALMMAGDWDGARAALGPIDSRRSALAVPVRVRLLAVASEEASPAETLAAAQDLLGATLSPPLRAWVLLVKGDAHWRDGNRDEARTQFDLARGRGAPVDIVRHAALRSAEINFELREFAQAVADVRPLVAESLPPDLRAAALMVLGEAAYHAGEHAIAADAYRHLLAEFPKHPEAAGFRLALAWTALRQGQRDDALRLFLEFAKIHPTDAHAVDALVLASELELARGAVDAARLLLDRIVTQYGGHPRAGLARFNRALLLLRAGQASAAQRELTAWVTRSAFPSLAGRAWVALGIALLAQGQTGDAAREFTRARREGATDLAGLGLGAAALAERRWDEAAREFTQARDTGTPPVVAAAEYGLAVVAFHRGKPGEFKTAARARLDATPRGTGAPRLLYALTAVAAEERDWPGALAYAKRLATDFPDDAAADDGLERAGSGAAAAGAWPVALEAYTLLHERYPQSAFAEGSRLAYGRALLEANRPKDARRALEPLAASPPADPHAASQAWLLLARAREADGDSAGALQAFSRAAQGGDAAGWPKEALFSHARLLAGRRRWAEARAVLARVLARAKGGEAGEAASAIADAWAGQGDRMAAVEYYLTAAYLVPEAPVGQRALLSAARTLAAAKDADGAATLYRKLLAQAGVAPDLVGDARKGLADLKR